MTTTVLFAGGGTAGHVFPAVATARALVRLGDYEPVFVGTRERLEARLVPEAGFRFEEIDALPLPRKLSPGLAKLPLGLRRSVRQVTRLIERHQPAAAASFGGYVSFPLSRAAWRNDVPLLLHEQNAIPGLANQLAARWASAVAVTFPSSTPWFRSARHQVVTGNPVREELLQLDLAAARGRARRRFDLDPTTPTLLVFGGSQGARSLNRAVARGAARWRDLGLQVIHVAGTKLHEEAIEAWRQQIGPDPSDGPRLRILDFVDDMGLAYAAADIVVCRAGATTIAELTALGLPAVLVPYPAATRDHQMANARALEAVGGAHVVPSDELNDNALVAAVRSWLDDPDARRKAARAAAAFGRRDAGRLVAAAIRDLVAPPAVVPGAVSDVRRHGSAELPAIDDEAFEAAFDAGTESTQRMSHDMMAAIDANEDEDRDIWGELRDLDEQRDSDADQGSHEHDDATTDDHGNEVERSVPEDEATP